LPARATLTFQLGGLLQPGRQATAAPLLAASLTEDLRRIGAVGVALTLPWLLFALPSGAVADRADHRWLMVAADRARSACMGLLALAVLTGQASIPVLLMVFFATTTADTVFHNAAAAPFALDRGQLRGLGGAAGHPAGPAATRTGRGPVHHPGRHR
jgi:MFS family permease